MAIIDHLNEEFSGVVWIDDIAAFGFDLFGQPRFAGFENLGEVGCGEDARATDSDMPGIERAAEDRRVYGSDEAAKVGAIRLKLEDDDPGRGLTTVAPMDHRLGRFNVEAKP